MAINSADPDVMVSVANTLDGYADSVETWGRSSAGVMQQHQYFYAATSVAGSTYGSASWARNWAVSLRSRASLLAAYKRIALTGAGSAGGAGAALSAGRAWALGATSAISFEDWYARHLAMLAQTVEARTLAADLADALAEEDFEQVWAIVEQLGEIDDPMAIAAFFNTLGAGQLGKLPNNVVGMTSHGNVHLRGTVGHPATLISILSRRLAAASNTDHLDFTGAEVIEASLDVDVMTQRYYTGYGGQYLFIADGFEATFLTSAAARYLPTADFPVMAQQVLVSEIDGQLPLDAREFLLPNVVAADGGAELVLLLLETDDLAALLDPRAYLNDEGAEALGPVLEQATIGLFEGDPLQAEYIIGTLINYAAEDPLYGNADVLGAALALVIPQLGAVVNDQTGSAYFGEANGNEVVVTEASLVAALASLARSDAGSASLYEGLTEYYGGLVLEADGDLEALNRVAISLADISVVLTTAIEEANISDAAEADERRAALIGMIDTVAGLVPLPGSKSVGTVGAKLIKLGYDELVANGTELLGTSYEDEARTEADATIDALLYTYTQLLTLSYLSSQGELAASIDEFFAANAYMDRPAHDFSDGVGGIATELTDRQAQSYGQWISFASADPAVNAAISRLLAEFLAGLPHYDD